MIMGYVRRVSAMFVALVVLGSLGARAEESLPEPTGEIVLEITGEIGRTNDGKKASFDMEMLMNLPQADFETTTIWTEGKNRFTGILLKDLLRFVEAKGTTLRAVALNDYAVEIPVSDAVEDGPIAAYLLNGELMSVREKGPLWIVYPYDQTSEYRSETIYSRSIWQLKEIAVMDQ